MIRLLFILLASICSLQSVAMEQKTKKEKQEILVASYKIGKTPFDFITCNKYFNINDPDYNLYNEIHRGKKNNKKAALTKKFDNIRFKKYQKTIVNILNSDPSVIFLHEFSMPLIDGNVNQSNHSADPRRIFIGELQRDYRLYSVFPEAEAEVVIGLKKSDWKVNKAHVMKLCCGKGIGLIVKHKSNKKFLLYSVSFPDHDPNHAYNYEKLIPPMKELTPEIIAQYPKEITSEILAQYPIVGELTAENMAQNPTMVELPITLTPLDCHKILHDFGQGVKKGAFDSDHAELFASMITGLELDCHTIASVTANFDCVANKNIFNRGHDGLLLAIPERPTSVFFPFAEEKSSEKKCYTSTFFVYPEDLKAEVYMTDIIPQENGPQTDIKEFIERTSSPHIPVFCKLKFPK